jgi:hypothetical protein
VFLLSKNKTYLAHILAKGIKKDFKPVIKYLEEMKRTKDHYARLIQQEILSGNLKGMISILQTLKPGMIGRNAEVASKCASLIAYIGKTFSDYHDVD